MEHTSTGREIVTTSDYSKTACLFPVLWPGEERVDGQRDAGGAARGVMLDAVALVRMFMTPLA